MASRNQKITRLLTVHDGHVRSAIVRVKDGNSALEEWKRPLQRLYPLEVQHEVDSVAEEHEDTQIKVLIRDKDNPTVVIGSG